MPRSSAVSVRGLVKRFGDVVAVDGVDLEVPTGICFGLLGPNGAGKTTTSEIILGIQKPTAGEVLVLGQHWGRGHDRPLRARLGIVLQETRFPERLTTRELVELFGSFYPRPRPAAEVIAEVGLTEKTGAWSMKLSGGQRQRLALACALVGDPELMILDEPTTGLDPQARLHIGDLVRAYRGRGRTTILSTHYMDEAERLCDIVAVIDHGKVIALGSPAELIARLGGGQVVEVDFVRNAAGTAGAGAAGDATAGVTSTAGAGGAGAAGADSAGAGAAGAGAATGQALADAELSRLPGVRGLQRSPDGLLLTTDAPHVTVPALLALATQRGTALARLGTRQATLEDVFLSLTGRHLRDV